MPSYLLDTNILLRLARFDDREHRIVRAALDLLLQRGAGLCFTPQNVAEFWNVFTRPKEKNGFGLTVEMADFEIGLLETQFTLLPDHESIYTEWRRLVLFHGVSGVQVHDARIVAAMLVHGISHLLTFNTRDFRRYPGITAVHPSEVDA